MANFGRLLITQEQTWWGGDVSGSPRTVRCCSLSRLPERKERARLRTPLPPSPFLTAHPSITGLRERGEARGQITSRQLDCYWTIQLTASSHWAVAMCQHVAISEYRKTTTRHGSRIGL